MRSCKICGRQIPDDRTICADCQRKLAASSQGDTAAQGERTGQPEVSPQMRGEVRQGGGRLPVILMTAAIVLFAGFFVTALLLGGSGKTERQENTLAVWGGTASEEADDAGPETISVAAPDIPYVEEPEETELEEPEETAVEETESEYVLPGSDSTYIDRAVIAALSQEELRLARNEIYARHGRMFDDPELVAYFTSKSWYEPLYDTATFDAWGDSILNEYEIANRDLIQEYESLYSDD